MRRHLASALSALLLLNACSPGTTEKASSADPAANELPTKWEAPPGNPLEYELAGFAKVLCSALFITGRSLQDAAEEDGYFLVPAESRKQATDTIVDKAKQMVTIGVPGGVKRSAKRFGDQGCVILPNGSDSVSFTPVKVTSALPDPMRQPWPMGDKLSTDPLPPEIKQDKLKAAVDSAFSPNEALTAAFVVTYKGRLIAERYQKGLNYRTQLPSWSMGKSLTATLMGQLIQEKVYDLWQPAPVDEWQGADDERKTIRIADIMRMSSGLRFMAPQDPNFDSTRGYPDHLYVYTGGIDAYKWSVTRPLQWHPNTVGRYRNGDPLTINYLVKKAVVAKGEEYLSYPQRHLFDKLGMRRMTPEPDPYGNFLLNGFELGSGRDWARLGNLYLQDGMWNGERILPEGFADFVRTPAPAWTTPQYGGFFWLNRVKTFPTPDDTYYMAGAGGQYTIIIPTHDLVVVRIGHYKGSEEGAKALNRALALLMEAVPEVRPVWNPPAGTK
ncbi:MAG: serine hydrolase [Gemmatimonadaceae bacterium]